MFSTAGNSRTNSRQVAMAHYVRRPSWPARRAAARARLAERRAAGCWAAPTACRSLSPSTMIAGVRFCGCLNLLHKIHLKIIEN